ncbi:YjjG family noncanonical pyrimidine nucleotidase [Salinimicrobium sp. MT39]|uniref:YjjG family noncanonical pyrimidine nucleotidase n=1 Tax=Salinimicrobium profundisediminis TaxID=2994553 RepID=A0A9X3I2F4_9FLAO|nr:YjjG family noncanonical pyrimidine nucleotidase [Salinimicrobium profundisediminis]MCX2838912.1 YjjG family noncanonical pyrimidine nucleotidase [Salinimicrobium profundisediminis]
MKFSNIRHIFFDLDHTLWDFDRNSGLAFNSIFEKHQIKVRLEEFLAIYAPINANYWKLYRDDKVTQEDLRYGRLRDSFKGMNVNVTDSQIKQLSIDYIEHLPKHNYLLAGTVEVLDYLRPLYKLHIITNGFKEVQYKKLESSGILKYFSSITTSEDVGVKKPNPKIFEVALGKAEAKVEESIMIGDNLEADILGAKDFGMQAILYNYYKTEYATDHHQVMEMKELTRYL